MGCKETPCLDNNNIQIEDWRDRLVLASKMRKSRYCNKLRWGKLQPPKTVKPPQPWHFKFTTNSFSIILSNSTELYVGLTTQDLALRWSFLFPRESRSQLGIGAPNQTITPIGKPMRCAGESGCNGNEQGEEVHSKSCGGQISAFLSLGQRSFFLERAVVRAETHHWYKCWKYVSMSVRSSMRHLEHPKFRKHLQRRDNCRTGRGLWSHVFWTGEGYCRQELAAAVVTCPRSSML